MDMTLYKIEAELHDLVTLRDQMEEAGEDTKPIEGAIQEYIRREVRKVDGVRAYIKHAEMMAQAADAEAKEQKARRDAWQGRADRLKEYIKAVMEDIGATRLDGAKGYIARQKNGGAIPVVINNELLIPEEYLDYTGTITGSQREWLMLRIGEAAIKQMFAGFLKAPNKERIRVCLEVNCEVCGGDGVATLPTTPKPVNCPACNGTGKRLVPGAHLGDRGTHIRVK